MVTSDSCKTLVHLLNADETTSRIESNPILFRYQININITMILIVSLSVVIDKKLYIYFGTEGQMKPISYCWIRNACK